MQYFLAIDIGASSGRHILGSIENDRIVLEEVYRFENGVYSKNGHLCWDCEKLFENILSGMARCTEIGKVPTSLGIDTWGVDFALLDENNRLIGDTVAYRDSRTDGYPDKLRTELGEDFAYARTGIAENVFNTVFQLCALRDHAPEQLKRAKHFLMIPDYFNFLLTGKMANEYTDASTTGLLDAEKRDWDRDLLEKLGLPTDIFKTPQMPATKLGRLLPEISERVGFDCEVILPASHDTGSAVVSLPAESRCVYISSGTWSLIGIESDRPVTTRESRLSGLTNEGGFGGKIRYLKNIMGLWMIQSIRREYEKKYSFAELSNMAREIKKPAMIDANDNRFLAPASMIDEIKAACRDLGQPIPETPGELAAVVYHGLARCYRDAIEQIEAISGEKYLSVNIMGGGCQDTYLNELTEAYTGRKVYAGPVEATACGNLLVQMIADGKLSGIEDARALIRRTFVK